MKILRGSELVGFIKQRQAKQVRALRQAHGIFPKLAIVVCGGDVVTDTYLNLKKAYGEDILIDVEVFRVHQDEILNTIDELNARDDIQAIIIQLPLADQSMTDEVLSAVNPTKDVDGLHPESQFDAATPIAINWLLAGYGVELVDKKVAVVGRGRLVGAPLEKMWRNSGVDVVTFEEGDDLSRLYDFDVVVAATGVSGLIKSGMVRSGAVLVDAGTSSDGGQIRGDVDSEVRQRQDVSITPERGGVGPLTVAALFDNVINACLRIANSRKSG